MSIFQVINLLRKKLLFCSDDRWPAHIDEDVNNSPTFERKSES